MNYIHLLNKFNQIYYILNEYVDLRNLWITTPDLWNSTEHKLLCYIKLNKSKSKGYLNLVEFRIYMISRVSNPNKQISLNFSGCDQLTDVSNLGNVHTLYLSFCDELTDVSSLGNVYALNLSYCHGITDVSSLGNVDTLDIRECWGLQTEPRNNWFLFSKKRARKPGANLK